MRRSTLAILSLSLVALAGCNLTGSVTPPDQNVNQNPDATAPIEIRDGDAVMVPGFSIAGRYVGVDGEWIQAFEYPNEDLAITDEAKVSPDGQMVDGNQMNWNGPVHFFRHGPVIVVYVGGNEGILQKLSDGGGQFAGN